MGDAAGYTCLRLEYQGHFLQSSMSSPKLAACCFNIVYWLIFMSTIYFSGTSEPTQISFPQFYANDTSMRALGDMKYDGVNHSIILNAKSAATSTGTCGMLIYVEDDLRIQDAATGRVATFNTSFTFTFTTLSEQQGLDSSNTSGNATVGTRLAFAVVDSYKGLVAMQELESYVLNPGACSSNAPVTPYFSITFDTEYNYNRGDPSNNFIIIRKQGVSNEVQMPEGEPYVYNFCGNNSQYCSYLSTGRSFTSWIDLTATRTLEVRLMNGSYPHVEKPLIPLLEYPNFELPKGMGEYASLSFRGSSDVNHITTHEISSWSFSCSDILETMPSSKNAGNEVQSRLGISFTVLGILILGFLSIWLLRRYNCRMSITSPVPSVFSYKELRNATKNFSESEKLGSGGFGTVYRGSIGNTLVAVKRVNYDSKYAEASFLAEISSLGLIQHRNVVQLLGWCHEKSRLLLVYDYMPNGSLNEWLHTNGSLNSEHKAGTLPCTLRHCILEEVAAAIEYLHTDCPQCVLHRDIKSSNIMLDVNFKAHLGDFGLARLMDHHKLDKTTMAAGTFGYMAPEVPFTGKATKESDVYSFGILVLEVMCGRQPLDMKAPEPEDLVLLSSAWRAHEAGTLLNMADPRLLQTQPPSGVTPAQPVPNTSNSLNMNDINLTIPAIGDSIEVEVEKLMINHLLHLGLLCCLPNPKARPTMGQVIRILEQIGDVENADYLVTRISMLALPHTKPLGLYPSIEFSQTADSTLQQFRT